MPTSEPAEVTEVPTSRPDDDEESGDDSGSYQEGYEDGHKVGYQKGRRACWISLLIHLADEFAAGKQPSTTAILETVLGVNRMKKKALEARVTEAAERFKKGGGKAIVQALIKAANEAKGATGSKDSADPKSPKG